MPTGAASGTIVIDIDIKNGRDGTIDLKQLQSELGPLPDTLTSLTPSGGEHRFFEDPGGIRSTDKLGRGIDVKAGGGYVVVPPSHGSYRWQDELRQPAELPEAWVVHVRSLAGSSGHSSKQPSADVRDIAAALQVIPNDNLPWEGWNRIAMATWRATGGSEAGLAAFDSFSRKSGKYDADTTRKRWHEIGRSPPGCSARAPYSSSPTRRGRDGVVRARPMAAILHAQPIAATP